LYGVLNQYLKSLESLLKILLWDYSMYQVKLRVLLGPLVFKFSTPHMHQEYLAYEVMGILYSAFNYGPLKTDEIRLVKLPI